jgi:hypothetical protein
MKELPAEGPSQTVRGQDLTTTEATILTTHIPKTSHPHTSTESHASVVDARRPRAQWGNHQPKRKCSQPTSPPQISYLHRRSNNSNTTKSHTKKPKLKRINIKTLRMKLKPSSRTSQFTFIKKMSAFGS